MIVSGFEKLNSLDVRGDFGFSGGFGLIAPGRSLFGFYNSMSGIYSRKKTLSGKRLSRMRFYGPSNPRTITQQAWRLVFADGKTAYDLLTSTEKSLLSKEARHYRMTGYNLFMSRWLQSNR